MGATQSVHSIKQINQWQENYRSTHAFSKHMIKHLTLQKRKMQTLNDEMNGPSSKRLKMCQMPSLDKGSESFFVL